MCGLRGAEARVWAGAVAEVVVTVAETGAGVEARVYQRQPLNPQVCWIGIQGMRASLATRQP